MSLYMAVPLLLFSFVLIGLITEQRFIPSLEVIAARMNLSESVTGASLLAFGSSAPELFTALLTLLAGRSQPSFGVGNVIGSALFQIMVVIGFAAMVKSATLRWRPVLRDGACYALAVAMLFWFIRDGVFTRLEGALLVCAYLAYLGVLAVWNRIYPRTAEKRHKRPPHKDAQSFAFPILDRLLAPIPDPARRPAWTLPVFALCLLLIGSGAWIFVEAGVAVARALAIDPTIVALTVIAGGSSAPELVSSALIARRGQGDMAVANALGSNTFDIFVSLGLPVLIATSLHGDIEQVGGANITSSVLLLLATLVLVLGLLALQRFRASKPFGALLILCYMLYVIAAWQGWIA